MRIWYANPLPCCHVLSTTRHSIIISPLSLSAAPSRCLFYYADMLTPPALEQKLEKVVPDQPTKSTPVHLRKQQIYGHQYIPQREEVFFLGKTESAPPPS